MTTRAATLGTLGPVNPSKGTVHYTAQIRRRRMHGPSLARSSQRPLCLSAGPPAGEEQPMIIRDVMTPNPSTVSPGDTIQNAARIMRDEDTGAVPVVDNGRPVGIITDRDIVVRAIADGGQLNSPV